MPVSASIAMEGASEGRESWSYDVPATYSPRTRYIRRTAEGFVAPPSADNESVSSGA